MKIRILSDLHREFLRADGRRPRSNGRSPEAATAIPRCEADVIVLAGDVATKQNGLNWIREFCGTTPTVYICGNHEFYGDQLPRVTERLKEATAGTNIHVLEDDSLEIGGWQIFGCTLWTDLALHGDWHAGAALAGGTMNDYKRVRNSARGYQRLLPKDTRQIHERSVEALAEFLGRHDAAKTIVVTHHAPSARSLPERFQADPLSCAYASHLDEFILRHQPHLWVHGHIHESSDYLIGKTRVIANPQGYPEAVNPGFLPGLVLEV